MNATGLKIQNRVAGNEHFLRQGGYTLVEVMIAVTIFSLLMAGATQFFIDGYTMTFVTEQKLEINSDIRDVTNDMADEARAANFFMMYQSFFPKTQGDPPGDFRSPSEGYSAEDYRQRKGNSGDFVVFVYTGTDPNPNDDTPAPIERLVGYLRDDSATNSTEAPVMRFELDVLVANQNKSVEDLIPEVTEKSNFKTVINLVTGLANGNLFYNIEDRSVLINGKIIHGNQAKQVTGTYNFTVSPRG